MKERERKRVGERDREIEREREKERESEKEGKRVVCTRKQKVQLMDRLRSLAGIMDKL